MVTELLTDPHGRVAARLQVERGDGVPEIVQPMLAESRGDAQRRPHAARRL